ncbi:MAG: acyltransferase [Acidimicrobiales bacterium]
MTSEERTSGPREVDHCWSHDELPPNVDVGPGVVITGAKAFARFFGDTPGALRIGEGSLMDGVRFGVGARGQLSIGVACRFSDAVLLAEESVNIGDRVMLGWNTTVADADFHPVDTAARRIDAEAVSPLGDDGDRPPAVAQPVIIGSDTWIGPNAVVLKGVTIGSGCFIEPGSVVVNDVPDRCRVIGNPAVVVEQL